MFGLTSTDIDSEALKQAQLHEASGGFVTFEGWVRNHNLGKSVIGLHYQAYEQLALSEGQKIIEEALNKFDVRSACCIHRIGKLEIGGIAVWVGAGSNHRDAAFAACRYIIDEIKTRVPIWKKELYVSGEREWVDSRLQSLDNS